MIYTWNQWSLWDMCYTFIQNVFYIAWKSVALPSTAEIQEMSGWTPPGLHALECLGIIQGVDSCCVVEYTELKGISWRSELICLLLPFLHHVISCKFSSVFKKAGFQNSLPQGNLGTYFSDIKNTLLFLHIYSQPLYRRMLLLCCSLASNNNFLPRCSS